jgi:CheY-like chemotaxis protein
MAHERTRILILDDEAPIRRLLSSSLEDYEEFAVREARSAESALEELTQAPADVDALLARIRVPGGKEGR